MCILFLKSELHAKSNEYSLILVNVRDEYYSRRTQCCSQYNQTKQLYGARDLHEGREGGTWLSMNTSNGKIGALLNILQPDSSIIPDKKSRGYLVVDYLTGNHSPQTYLEEVRKNVNDYNKFVLVTMQVNTNGCFECSYFSNVYNCGPLKLDYGVHAFGNNEIHNQLWPKVSYGKSKFEQLVNKYSTTESKPELINEIFNLLSENILYPLDDQMKRQGNGKPISILEKLNSINVSIPEAAYGSRTWTIILIDGEYNVDYIEKTMKEPIDIENIEWIVTENRFNLNKPIL